MVAISNLPLEVLTHIFGDDCTSAKDLSFSRSGFQKRHRAILKPISKVAYQVCRHWRNLIRNNSAFYFISFTFNEHDDIVGMQSMKKLISRYQHWADSSPSADIDVNILLRPFSHYWGTPVVVNRNDIISLLIDFLVSVANRWRLFSFEAAQVSDYNLINKALSVRAAQGKTLLSRLISFTLKGNRGLQAPIDSIVEFIAPNLEAFQIQDIPTSEEHVLMFTRAAGTMNASVIRLGLRKNFALHLLDHLPHLVHLKFSSDSVCYETSIARTLGRTEVGWQSLRRLTLDCLPLGPPIDPQPPWPGGFPNVTFIQLNTVPLISIKHFFSSFTLPSLHTLVLQHMAYVATDSTGDIWRKADGVFPKTIKLLNVNAGILEFVIQSLAESSEELVIEAVAEDGDRIDPDMTRVPLLNVRVLSFEIVSWKWVKWVVDKATLRDLEIFRWQRVYQAEIFWDSSPPALLLIGQRQLQEIHLLDLHNDRGGALLSQLAGQRFRRLNLNFAEIRYVSQDWSQFCETHRQVLLQVNEMKLGIPGRVYTSTRSNRGDFSLAAFSNVIKLSLDLRQAKYVFLRYAFQLSEDPHGNPHENLVMPHLRSLTLRLEMDKEWFNAIIQLIRVREEQDMALLELIIMSFAPISPSDRRRLDDQLNFFTFRKLDEEFANPLWQ